jgi:type I restriction enzyme R subunit
MSRLNENAIEQLAIELLEQQGWKHLYGPDIAPNSDNPQRSSYQEVLLPESLRSAIRRLNPSLPGTAHDDAFKQVERVHAPELIASNQAFHRLLTEGVKVTVRQDGNDRGEIVWLVDFDCPENNEFWAVNQFTITENNQSKRPDLILFVNGLPLVVIELKNPADENATLFSAFQQLQTYKQAISSFFACNELLVISDGLEARAGSLSAEFSRFMAWKSEDSKTAAERLISQLETLIAGMLNKRTLLDLVRSFICFEQTEAEDPKTGLITISTVKKLAAYHQYHAVNKAVASTINAASAKGSRKGGVVWHTQGSGKSLSMVFFTGKIVLALSNPTVVVITDRNDLDEQLFDTFAAARQLLRQEPVQAESRQHLKELLHVASGGVVFATIQKFQPEEGNVHELLSDRENIVVIADEAHRTQYGFHAKTVDDRDEHGNVMGKKTVYGFAKYLRDALPNATYLGFTGTPIEKSDVNTQAVFGEYVDIYDISQSIADGSTVRIYYESRLAKISLTEEGRELVQEFDDELENNSVQNAAKWARIESLLGSRG